MMTRSNPSYSIYYDTLQLSSKASIALRPLWNSENVWFGSQTIFCRNTLPDCCLLLCLKPVSCSKPRHKRAHLSSRNAMLAVSKCSREDIPETKQSESILVRSTATTLFYCVFSVPKRYLTMSFTIFSLNVPGPSVIG